MALIVRYVRAVGGDRSVLLMLERAGERRTPRQLEDETRWSTYAQRLRLFESAALVLDDPQVGRHIGETAIDHGVGAGVKLILRSFGNPARVYRSLPRVAPKFSTVSEIEAHDVTDTSAVITCRVVEGHEPHRMECDYVTGLLSQVPVLFGLDPARVTHLRCQVAGEDRCVYDVRWRQVGSRGLRARRARLRDLEEQVRTLRESANVLRSTTVDLVSPDDLEEVLDSIARKALAAVSSEAFVLAVRSGEHADLKLFHDGLSEEQARTFVDQYLVGAEPGIPHIAAPVESKDRSYGFIASLYPSGKEFLEEDISLLEVYARHAAVSLDVATALQEARNHEASAAALLQLAGSLASASAIADVDRAIVSSIRAVCGAPRCSVMHWDPAAQVLRNAAWVGFPREMAPMLDAYEVHPSDTPLLSSTLGADEAVIFERAEVTDSFVASALDERGLSMTATIPVKVLDAPFGVISLHFVPGSEGLPREALKDRLAIIANLAGKAYENASVLHAQIERVERLSGQKEILEMVARGEGLREILDAVCLTVESNITDSRCGLFLLDEESNGLQAVATPTLPSDLVWHLNGMKPGPFSGSAGTAVFREHAVFVEDIEADRGWEDRREIARSHGIRAAWALPIFAPSANKVLGALAVYLGDSRRPGEFERAFMETAVQLTSIAIERRELESKLTHQAFHDALTGLPNRALFSDRVQHALDRSARHAEVISVLLLDLDDFKSVNDSLGHLAGDELLRVVADRIRRCLRAADTPARLGGDEFAVLLEGTDQETACAVAQRILTAIADPIRIMGIELRMSGSIGVAVEDGSRGKMQDLLRNADTAMYAAKAAGKASFEVFEQKMQSGLLRRLELQSELQRAIEREEFILHYQPILKLRPHTVVGVEALVRWNHPTRGLLGPSEFIPASEDSGLIVDIGRLVLRRACADANAWMRSFPREHPLRIGVNFSVRQLQEPGLVDEVQQALEEAALPAGFLVVEITESVLMHDPDDVAVTLVGLKRLGVQIAIDDFGTGYSSLSYLRRFPVNILKIDKFFVQGLDRGPEEAAYGRAIVRLGHSLELDVVAEGVEHVGDHDALLDMDCDFAQGYLFSPPLPADEVVRVKGFSTPAEKPSS